MAKKKSLPTKQVRVARDVAELSVIVAAYRRMDASDLITQILRPVLERMHAEEIARASNPVPAKRKGGA